jgi:hypothetical protein
MGASGFAYVPKGDMKRVATSLIAAVGLLAGTSPFKDLIAQQLERAVLELQQMGKADTAALIERLAEKEHERWADWMAYFFTKCIENAEDGSLIVPGGYVAALRILIGASYAELSRDQQEKDIREVARYWPLIAPFVEGAG